MGLQEVRNVRKGLGPGSEAAIRAVQSLGIRVRHDHRIMTPVPHKWLPTFQETPRVVKEKEII